MTQIVAINSNEALFAFLKMHISAIGRYKSNVGPFTLMNAEEMNVRNKKKNLHCNLRNLFVFNRGFPFHPLMQTSD